MPNFHSWYILLNHGFRDKDLQLSFVPMEFFVEISGSIEYWDFQ